MTIRALHIGPSTSTPGGMASVISVYCDNPTRALNSSQVTSWKPNGKGGSVFHALRAAVELIRQRRAFDAMFFHLSERGSLLREGGLMALAYLFGVRTVAIFHGARMDLSSTVQDGLLRLALRFARVPVALGPDFARELQRRTRRTVAIIGNPVIIPRNVVSHADRSKRIVFAGELGYRKGFDLLHSAWHQIAHKFPDWELVAYGPRTENISDRYLIGIDYRGAVPREQVIDIVATSSFLVLPSRSEVLPMSIMESLASGTPVVATKVGEIGLLEGAPGVVLVESENVFQLSKAIESSIDATHLDPLVIQDWIRERFSIESIAEQYARVLA